MADHQETSYVSRPKTLDPVEYFALSPAQRKVEEERAALRARLKRQYQLQLNDPSRTQRIEDPALTRWTYARTINVPANVRPTPKTSLLGLLFGAGPLVFWYFVLKKSRDRKERLIQEGKLDRRYHLSY
ncbi:NADH dehydrogenase [ubiquinone] 1 beta subcomplex subunit 4 [Lepisosteus oculatus]|uniref:NADH dehydrogenase [ubiquinone] 1 beta subcomplex subunit 4 n=1 Tax=Lepisosteus oculatus TaxID=7918 RepID=UPI003721D69E